MNKETKYWSSPPPPQTYRHKVQKRLRVGKERVAPPQPLFTPHHNKLLAAWSVRYFIGSIPQPAQTLSLKPIEDAIWWSYRRTKRRKLPKENFNHIQLKEWGTPVYFKRENS
jgi:L,D-peptidoglycan transpeptidase YkuD (ErfK/YbiS/YcfS/YnhG family)